MKRNRRWRLRQPAPPAIFAAGAGVFEGFRHGFAIGGCSVFPKGAKASGNHGVTEVVLFGTSVRYWLDDEAVIFLFSPSCFLVEGHLANISQR